MLKETKQRIYLYNITNEDLKLLSEDTTLTRAINKLVQTKIAELRK